MKPLFTDTQSKEIEAAVARAESLCNGEIVVVYRPASGEYRSVLGTALLLGWTVSSLALWLIGWPPSLGAIFSWQLVGMSVACALTLPASIKRLVIPRIEQSARVHQSALATFSDHGVGRTRHHTGILIYLSRLEHRVEILADSGINAKVPPGYWDDQTSSIARSIKSGNATAGVIAAVERIGEKLAEHFPKTADDTNELPDRPR